MKKKELRAALDKATTLNELMAKELYAIHKTVEYDEQCFDGLADHTKLMVQGLRRDAEGLRELLSEAHLAKAVSDGKA